MVIKKRKKRKKRTINKTKYKKNGIYRQGINGE